MAKRMIIVQAVVLASFCVVGALFAQPAALQKEVGGAVINDIKSMLKTSYIDLLASSEFANWDDIKSRFEAVKRATESFESKYSAELKGGMVVAPVQAPAPVVDVAVLPQIPAVETSAAPVAAPVIAPQAPVVEPIALPSIPAQVAAPITTPIVLPVAPTQTPAIAPISLPLPIPAAPAPISVPAPTPPAPISMPITTTETPAPAAEPVGMPAMGGMPMV